jgi:ATP-dependent Zn protease
MVAEDHVSGNESKTVGSSQDLIQATSKAKKMVVEYGFGEIMKNASLVELQDYAITSGKEVLDDIQKILDRAKEQSEELISRNSKVLSRLVEKINKEILINNEGFVKFFDTNPLN